MKTIVFAKRNFKEIIRDPLNLFFMIGLPLFLLLIFQQFNIPAKVYSINNFAPSIVIFSFSFISLFAGLLIAKDRTSSFLTRLFASPLKPLEFILGYTIALLPIVFVQSTLFLVVSLLFDLAFNYYLIITIFVLAPISLLFIALGILIGCSFSDKQAPGISSIIVQLMAFTSGMWFDINSLSKSFQTICNILPFRYALDMTRLSLNGNYNEILKPFLILSTYIIGLYVIALLIFKRKMTSDNK